MKLQEEEPIDYNECTREQLIEIVLRRDENFNTLGNHYLEMSKHINNLFQVLTNESINITKRIQTEMTLTESGVPSADGDKEMERDMGKLQAFDMVTRLLLPIYNQ
jgi:hypothetical protein